VKNDGTNHPLINEEYVKNVYSNSYLPTMLQNNPDIITTCE
jgi:hypothetical protein